MRRRDRHTAFVLGGMVALNILTALCTVTSTAIYRRRFRAVSEDLAVSIKTSEKASVDAASTALALLDQLKARGEVDEDALPPPVVLGYGQTRSKGAWYIYRDVRDSYGEVRREFVSRVPFKAK